MFNDNSTSSNCIIDETKNCSNFNDYINTNSCNTDCNNTCNNNSCNCNNKFNFSGIIPIIVVVIIFILFFCNNKNEC